MQLHDKTLQARERATMREAWTAFWRHPASGTGCIRGAPDIAQALREHWSAFADSLSADARVLDLGCGAGAAALALKAVRRDLHLTGVDFARLPLASDARIRLLSDVAMEQLPFEDRSFDSAISQFGYEYSRMHKTAHQMARVLGPGGWFSLIVHHADSSVVATNRASLTAILAVQDMDMREAFLAGNAFALSAKLSSLQRAHPGHALVQKLSRSLPARARRGGPKGAAWNAIEEILAQERAILEALDGCCVAPEELDGWLGPLRQHFAIESVSILRKPNGVSIAWRITGTRAG
jgi:SAM-dependent methyltransferase